MLKICNKEMCNHQLLVTDKYNYLAFDEELQCKSNLLFTSS